jgi:acyl dehydratase
MKDLIVGQTAEKSRRFTASEVAAYRDLTGDDHLRCTRSKAAGSIVPGPLLGGLLSELLGTQLPGRGTNWLKQRYEFLRPAFVDEEIKAAVEITRLRPEKALVNLAVRFSGPDGEIICSGETLALVKELEKK